MLHTERILLDDSIHAQFKIRRITNFGLEFLKVSQSKFKHNTRRCFNVVTTLLQRQHDVACSLGSVIAYPNFIISKISRGVAKEEEIFAEDMYSDRFLLTFYHRKGDVQRGLLSGGWHVL